MNWLRMTGLAFTAVLLMVGSSLADEFSDPGGYFVLGGVTAFQDFRQTGDAEVSNSLGLEVRGGYRFLKNLAVEGEVDTFVGFDLEPNNPDEEDLTVEALNFTANVKGYLPFGRIQPYGLVGLGGMYARLRTKNPAGTICAPGYYGWYCRSVYGELGDKWGFLMKFGGGLDFYVSPGFAITLDASYVLPFGTIDVLRNVSFNWGFLLRF